MFTVCKILKIVTSYQCDNTDYKLLRMPNNLPNPSSVWFEKIHTHTHIHTILFTVFICAHVHKYMPTPVENKTSLTE